MLTNVLLALNALLLTALFGLRAAKYANSLEAPEPQQSEHGLFEYRAPVVRWEKVPDSEKVQVVLDDGTTWTGMGSWWYSEDNKSASNQLSRALQTFYRDLVYGGANA